MAKNNNLPLRSAKRKKFVGLVEMVDSLTGEIVSSSAKFKTSPVKTIFATMYLNDENVYEFVSGLGNPGKVLAYVLKDYNDKTGMFYFSTHTKALMAKELGLSVNTIRTIIREFANKKTIVHIGGPEYMVNPRLFYKGAQEHYDKQVNIFDDYHKIALFKETQANIDAKTVKI